MPHRSRAESTPSMREFGKLLKKLRSPDIEEYRQKLAVHHWKKARKSRVEVTTTDEAYLQKWASDSIAIYARPPENFRNYQRHATRVGVKTKPLRLIAKQMGISKNTLHDYEQGKRYPPAEFVFEFCAALGISPLKLMDDWLRCHPNPIINKYSPGKGGDDEFTFWKDDGIDFDPGKRDTIHFIQAAIRYAEFMTDTHFVWGIKGHEVALIAAMIIDRTLSRGKSPHPANIETDPSLYSPDDFPYEIDESGYILDKQDEWEPEDGEITEDFRDKEAEYDEEIQDENFAQEDVVESDRINEQTAKSHLHVKDKVKRDVSQNDRTEWAPGEDEQLLNEYSELIITDWDL